MTFYKPTYIKKYETGLVQDRPEFLLPDDAYPILENFLVWRERLIRKSGYKILGRLRRVLVSQNLMVSLSGAGAITNNIKTLLSLETNADIEPGSISISDGTNTYTDNGLGVLTGVAAGTGTVNYSTMAFTISGGAALGALTASFNYFPRLPVMGVRSEELNNINFERMIVFDQTYAYTYSGGFNEFIPGTTWTGLDSDFFWSTNYWVGDGNQKIFWVTNFSGITKDPIRYTNGTAWADFAPEIDSVGTLLNQCLAMIPFRGRMVTFNTFEGLTLGTSVHFRNRIRWAQIGNPFSVASPIVTVVSADAWRDDIPGKGGFLDIPTSEDIVSVGFVRDNVVIFCERSTWQLRYTGRSIAPFAVERVNSELGAESTFSSVQFDTSLVGIGDKGIVQCDSYKSERIDVKIPDLTFRFSNLLDGVKRVHGIRDLQQRIAYWTYPSEGHRYPDRRLVYNYENDSWSIFTDSFTALGTFQDSSSLQWQDFPSPNPNNQWQTQNYPWIAKTAEFPSIVGGNQQGFVEYLGQYNFEANTTNDHSLSIKNITGSSTNATLIESPDHNLSTGQVVFIQGVPTGTKFSTLNLGIFGINKTSDDEFELFNYDPVTEQFSSPQLNNPGTYLGGATVAIRDNFRVVSKKFNFLDTGDTIQFGYMDILLQDTSAGAITLKVYVDYNDSEPTNQLPQNNHEGSVDSFFNVTIPTYVETFAGSSKNFQRVYCNVRGSFVTLEFTLSNVQMVGNEQESVVQIDNQILWMRPAGKQLNAF